MENIKSYCKNLLLGIATVIVAITQQNKQSEDETTNIVNEYDDDYHMFI